MKSLRKFVNLAAVTFFAMAIFAACGENTEDFTETPLPTANAALSPTSVEIQGQNFSTELEILNLRGENLSNEDILPLQYMKNLTELNLGNNDISDIAPLSELKNLVWLELDGNRISDISALSTLENLSVLFINDNEISDISPLVGLNLHHLSVHNNQISDLTPLADFNPALYVNLTGNPITDWSPVEHIEDVLGRPEELTEQAARRVKFTLFAKALREFNETRAPLSEYFPPDFPMSIAHIVDLDGNGTLGVLALRHEETEFGIFVTGRIFFVAVREIFYKDLGFLAGFPFVAAVTQPQNGGFGRPVLTGGDGETVLYTTFDFIFSPQHGWQVVEYFAIRHEMWEGGEIHFQSGEEHRILTKEEFAEISENFGLGNLILQFSAEEFIEISENHEFLRIGQFSMPDHTEFIFSQSFE
ncbi:MAG: hypothetical protein FWG68_05845 [Defluviitaleaceae bacterium]|nr:hypothetical protein [Defluviitaleaceae bacterium]